MNVVNALDTMLDSILAAVSAAVPATRTCTRQLEDFSLRDDAALQSGVYTLLSNGMEPYDDDRRFLNVLLVGQVMKTAAQATLDIEKEELLMICEIEAFVKTVNADPSNPQVLIASPGIKQSAQTEGDYGWVSAPLRIGPFFFDPFNISSASAFLLFHADSDINADGVPDLTTEEAPPQ